MCMCMCIVHQDTFLPLLIVRNIKENCVLLLLMATYRGHVKVNFSVKAAQRRSIVKKNPLYLKGTACGPNQGQDWSHTFTLCSCLMHPAPSAMVHFIRCVFRLNTGRLAYISLVVCVCPHPVSQMPLNSPTELLAT